MSTIRWFRKRPVEVRAVKFIGSNWRECCEFIGAPVDEVWSDDIHQDPGWLDIETLEGRMECSPGDWIIEGVAGEFYPCKPDIFAATYEGPIALTSEDATRPTGDKE